MRTLYFCSVVSSFFLTSFFLFLCLISLVPEWMDIILLSANLECRSERFCTWLAGNTGRKNDAKKLPSGHHRTTLSGWIFATKARIENSKKVVKQQYLLHMSPQYGELTPTSGWDWFGCLRHLSKFQRLSRLGSVTARQSSSGHQPNFAVLNRGCHLYLAGRPSRWALARTLVYGRPM